MPDSDFSYDVALSFADEDREYVSEVADGLRRSGIAVFYDDYERGSLWGRDLYEHLDWVYRKAARYTVLFISGNYARKVWTNHERRSAQARALEEHREYVLPARFDRTEVEGLPPTIGYVDLRTMAPEDLVALITEKIGPRATRDYFPPDPVGLFQELDLDPTDESETQRVNHISYEFYRSMGRMSEDERHVIAALLNFGCPGELPELVHMSLDLLSRITGMPHAQVLELLVGTRSLGYRCRTRTPPDTEIDTDDGVLSGDDVDLALEWYCGSDMPTEDATEIARATVKRGSHGFCEEHGLAVIERLDSAAFP